MLIDHVRPSSKIRVYRLGLVKKSLFGGGLENGQTLQELEVRYNLPESQS
jgi:hypothetical protein